MYFNRLTDTDRFNSRNYVEIAIFVTDRSRLFNYLHYILLFRLKDSSVFFFVTLFIYLSLKKQSSVISKHSVILTRHDTNLL